MTKVEYASVYAIIATVMIGFMLYIGKNADKKSILVRRQLYLVLVMNLVYFFSFFINDEFLLVINHSLVLLFEVWLLFAVVHFALYYAESRTRFTIGVISVSMILCICDSVMLIYNSFTQKFFEFAANRKNESFLEVYPCVNLFYYLHMILCGIMLLVFVIIMIRKALVVNSINKSRYVTLSMVFGIGLIMCMIMRYFGNYVNFSSVVLLTIGETSIFYVFYHLPKQRKNMMKDFVIKNVAIPILLFDYEDELLVINEPAKKLTDARKGMTLQEYSASNNLKYILTPQRRAEGKTKEFSMSIPLQNKTYIIHGQELWDKKNNFIGTLMVYNDISKEESLKDEATFHATRDKLTGLWNREYFLEAAEKTLDANPGREYVCIVSDIHQFKMFNDILGRKMGDDLLISIAQGFEERKKEGWLFSRATADKFALLMPLEDFEERRFVEACKSVIEKRNYALTVHFYLGVYIIRDREISVSEICDRAYMALESIKGSAKYIAYYDNAIRDKLIYETIHSSDLELALKNKEFSIYLQPQIDTKKNKIVGCEALVRWMSPKRGCVPAVEFISSFEENGMISELDYYVWEMACQTLRRWKDNGDETSTISVNISSKDFYLSDIYNRLTGLVEKYEISPRNLVLEITETAFVLNIEEQMTLVKKLQNYGFIVQIDDFGSGYSSLYNLKNITVDVIKLDMKFFEKTTEEDRAEKIIESIVNLSYNLKMPVIAEGVETLEQVCMLRKIGCTLVQGYYYSEPLPLEEYEEYVRKFS